MTVAQAAKKLEVCPSTVYGLIAAGRLRYVRVGLRRGVIRISDDAVQEYLARCTFEVKEEKAAPVSSSPKLKHLRL